MSLRDTFLEAIFSDAYGGDAILNVFDAGLELLRDTSITGTLAVSGAADFASTVSIDGNVSLQADIQQTGDAGTLPAYTMTSYSNSAGAGGSQIYQQRAKGTLAVPLIVAAENHLANYRADAYDGAKFVRTLSMRVRVTEGSTPAVNDVRGTMYWLHGRKTTGYDTGGGVLDTPLVDPEDWLMKLVPTDPTISGNPNLYNPRKGDLYVSGDLHVGEQLIVSGGVVEVGALPTDLLYDADIGVTVQAYGAKLDTYQALSAGAGFLANDGAGNISWTTPGGGGLGTVTSVALAMPAIFSVSGSPVTTTGTLTASLATQTANYVWAGPTSGGAAAPTFRALVAADIPSLSSVYQPLDATLTSLAGLNSFAVGDLIYASGTDTLAKLADVAVNQVLVSGGVGVAPAYSATPRINALGVGAAAGATTGSIVATSTVSNPTANQVQTNVTFLGSITADATNSFMAGNFDARLDTGGFNQTSGGPVGAQFRARATGASGTINSIRGLYADTLISGANNVTSAYGVQIGPVAVSAASVVSNAYGMMVQSHTASGGGAITTGYGLYLQNQSAATNNYGLYLAQSSTGTNNFALYQPTASVKSYFNGYVGIGTTSAAYPLHVVGESYLNGAVTLGTAGTELITCGGRFLPRSVTDAGPMTATGGTQKEILWNTSNSAWYGCTATHATAATWTKIATAADIASAVTLANLQVWQYIGAGLLDDGLDGALATYMALPPNYAGGAITFDFWYVLDQNGAAGEEVVFKAYANSLAHNEASPAYTGATQMGSTTTVDVSSFLAANVYKVSFSGTPTGAAAGELLKIQLARFGSTEAADDYAGGITPLGVRITFS